MPVSKQIMEQIKLLIPPLNGTLHKGQSGKQRLSLARGAQLRGGAGRVGVLGGAKEYVLSGVYGPNVADTSHSYSGAPYFASIAAQRVVSLYLKTELTAA